MLIAFFDSKGLIHHEYVLFGQTVNAIFYLSVLKRLVACIRRMRPEYCEPGCWCPLHDNAKPHTAHIIQQYFTKNQITVLNHPPCWPDLAPPDFFLFPKVKLELKGTFFQYVNVIQATVTRHLKVIPIDEYAHNFESLNRHSEGCITRGEDYVEA